MFEWRIFKQLNCLNYQEFVKYVESWTSQLKYQLEQRLDIYIILPQTHKEANKRFGLKLRNGKYRENPLKIKLKGKHLEFKNLKTACNGGFELWEKLLSNKMNKQVKIALFSHSLLKKLEGNGTQVNEFIRKSTAKKEAPQASQQVQQVEEQKSQTGNKEQPALQQQSKEKQSKEKKPKKVSKKTTSIYQNEQQAEQEQIFTVDPEQMKNQLKLISETIQHKIKKHNITASSIKEYVELFDKCREGDDILFVFVQKYVAKDTSSEETLMRIRCAYQHYDPLCSINFDQYFLSCEVQSTNQNFNIDPRTLQTWNERYQLETLGPNQKIEEVKGQFVGGYPEFLSSFIKLV